MTAHSKIGASSAKRWMSCPGSVVLSEGIESKSSVYAQEGTMAHALAEWCLRTQRPAAYELDDEFTYVDHGVQKSGVVTQDMVEAVQVYLDECSRIQSLGKVTHPLIEHRFHMSFIHEDLFGTADFICYVPSEKTLYVRDYKHGAGVPVEVDGNPQLKYYALGALLETGYPAVKVDVGIVQPRCPHPDGPVRSQVIDTVDLLDFAEELRSAAMKVEVATLDYGKDAVSWAQNWLHPGDHCGWCPAAANCPSIKAKAQEVAKQEFGLTLSYNPEELAETLRWLPVLEAWIKNVREYAYGEAEHGNPIPGWKIVEKRANRKWRDGVEGDGYRVAEALGLNFGDICEMKFLTPAKVEKLLEKDRRGLLEQFVTKESSGFALVPEDDKRPAVKADAKSEFESVG